MSSTPEAAAPASGPASHTLFQLDHRSIGTENLVTGRPHGYARYRLDGCRCYVCAFARSEYDAARDRAIAYGTWQPWTDAAPVRAHIQTLRSCELGLRRIAALAGCDRQRPQAILTGRPDRGVGPQEKCRPALAAAILAVEPSLDNLGSVVSIDATGTVRRLKALIARGFPQSVLSEQLGHAGDNLVGTLARTRVIVRTARAVRDVYEQLWNADPANYGASLGGITRARRHAEDQRWAPVGAWDDDTIDDPAAYPDWTGKCGTPEGYHAHHVHKIPACDPCLTARAATRRARKTGAAA